MKRITSIIICFLLLLNLCSCKNNYDRDCVPAKQENTYWVSENGDISFYVHGFSRVLGKMNVDDEQLEVQFWWGYMGMSNLQIYSLDYLRDNTEPYEHEPEYYLWEEWTCVFLGKDKFIATAKKTTYFEEGERIVFKKADVDDNEIVYPPPNDVTDDGFVHSDETPEYQPKSTNNIESITRKNPKS